MSGDTAEKLHIDFETCSMVDLRKAGVWRYAEDPSTQILCMAWSLGSSGVNVWVPGEKLDVRFIDHVRAGGEIHAWNAMFEIAVWEKVGVGRGLLPAVSDAQFRDTMAAAAYWGLPLGLDDAAHAIGAHHKKDRAGHALMLRMSKPRSIDKATGKVTWWHETDPARLDLLKDYCRKDVLAERDIGDRIPPLPKSELDVWRADLAINRRGVALDMALVSKMDAFTNAEKIYLDQQMSLATGGEVKTTNQVARLIDWLGRQGVSTKSLDKASTAELLDRDDLPDRARKVIELRQIAAKSSTSKLEAMKKAVCADGRVRGLIQYYGAFRTGRWAGRLIQIQNLPRPTTKKVPEVIDMILSGCSPDELGMFINPLDAVSSAIRGCFVAVAGRIFTQNDLSQIEARVVAWLSGQDDILEVFANGDDVYVYTANKNGSDDRQFGKVLVLACGFGMGWSKFQATAKTYGLALDDEFAKSAVSGWRSNNPMIVGYWRAVQSACVLAIQTPGTVREVGPRGRAVRIGVSTKGKTRGCLLIQLPSARYLVYRDAALEDGEYGPEVTYMGMNQYTRKWERLRTYGGKLVENITQAVARDVLAEATVKIERVCPGIVMSVHDELIHEGLAREANHVRDTITTIMNTAPAWAPGLPVASDGWQGDRYRK